MAKQLHWLPFFSFAIYTIRSYLHEPVWASQSQCQRRILNYAFNCRRCSCWNCIDCFYSPKIKAYFLFTIKAIYFVRMPFEIIKTQIQIGKIESNAHSILKYVRSRKLLQLYEGFRLTFLRDLVFAGSELPLWDLMKVISTIQVL